MNKFNVSLIVIAIAIYLTACVETGTITVTTTKNPDAEEVLRLDKNADIFQLEELIYKADIDWVDEIQLTKNKLVGEITEVFSGVSNKSFNDGMANKLPLGAKIYSSKERGDILIVEYDGKVKNYLALVEG